MKHIFKSSWLKEGEIERYCTEKGYDVDKIRMIMEDLQEHEGFKILYKAMQDYKRTKVNEIANLASMRNVQKHGFDKMMAVAGTQVRLPDWIMGMVKDLRGFEESERMEAPDLVDMYT